MNTETQNHTPGDWHLVKDRLVTQPDPPNGPYVRLAMFLPLASQADKDLIARAPALLAENARLEQILREVNARLISYDEAERKWVAENARLREVIELAVTYIEDGARHTALERLRAALCGERFSP